MLPAYLRHRANVGHAHRLPPAGVIGDGEHDDWNSVHTDAFNGGAERVHIHIALERVHHPRLAPLGDDQIASLGPFDLNIGARRIKVSV